MSLCHLIGVTFACTCISKLLCCLSIKYINLISKNRNSGVEYAIELCHLVYWCIITYANIHAWGVRTFNQSIFVSFHRKTNLTILFSSLHISALMKKVPHKIIVSRFNAKQIQVFYVYFLNRNPISSLRYTPFCRIVWVIIEVLCVKGTWLE